MFGFLDLEDEPDVEGGLFFVGGILVSVDWGVLVGDGIGVLVDEGSGVLVGDGVGVLVRGGGGVFVREAEEVLVREVDGVLVGDPDRGLVREANGVLVGEADEDGFSSSIIVGMEGGKSSTTSGSSCILVLVFGRSNKTLLGFFSYEDNSINKSLYAFVISCRACSLVALHSGLRDRNSNIFLFIALVLVGWEFNQILKAL